jgi:uncharacterized lipoprotein YmbA
LADWQVSTRDQVIQRPDCRVNLDVRRFQYSRAARVVSVDALWTVACAGQDKRMGQTVVREGVAGGEPSVDAVVTAQGRALAPLSRDIALALRALVATNVGAPR